MKTQRTTPVCFHAGFSEEGAGTEEYDKEWKVRAVKWKELSKSCVFRFFRVPPSLARSMLLSSRCREAVPT